MRDKTALGNRYTCFQCGTKFYDLNRPTATCPECGADQAEAPLRDIKALLSSGGGRRRKKKEPEHEEAETLEVDDDADIDDDLDGDDDELDELDEL